MTVTKPKQKAQQLAQLLARLRDSDADGYGTCISCGKEASKAKGNWQGGHYFDKNWFIAMFITIALHSCNAIKRYNAEGNRTVSQIKGEGELLKQESQKKVLIEKAKAKLEVAKLSAQSEIERAKGVAEANKIIGESLKNNEAYLRYLWINALNENQQNVIYVPTEANLPR